MNAKEVGADAVSLWTTKQPDPEQAMQDLQGLFNTITRIRVRGTDEHRLAAQKMLVDWAESDEEKFDAAEMNQQLVNLMNDEA